MVHLYEEFQNESNCLASCFQEPAKRHKSLSLLGWFAQQKAEHICDRCEITDQIVNIMKEEEENYGVSCIVGVTSVHTELIF